MNLDFVQKNESKVLVFIVLGAFILSLFHSFYYQIEPSVDAAAYDIIAWNMVIGNGFKSEPLDVPIQNDRAIIRVGPGYQFFLAAVYYAFGHHYEIVWIIQAMLHAVSAYLVFLISKNLFGDRKPFAGLFAAALVAFSPDLIIASSMLLIENLAIFLALVLLYFLFSYYDYPSFFLVPVIGFFFAASFLARTPFGILLPIILAVFFLKKKFFHSVIFVIVFAAVMSPWVIRNYNVYGKFIPSTVTFGNNFLAGNHPKATGELDDSRYEYVSQYKKYDLITADSLMAKDTMEYIKQHPFHFVKLTFYRVSMYFAFSRPTGWWPYLNGLDKFFVLGTSAIYSFILFVLGGAGMWRAIRDLAGEEKNKLYLFLAALFSMPFSIIFIIVETRYRYPVYPFLAVFAGYAVYKIMTDRRVVSKLILISVAVIFVNGLFDVLRNFERVAGRMGLF